MLFVRSGGRDVLVTDPWFGGDDEAYFGSWTTSHVVLDEVERRALECPFVWISHGHPDHLNEASLLRLREKQFLVGEHVGGRLAAYLRALDIRVAELRDREWQEVAPGVRVQCITTSYQDSALLVEASNALIINLNDSGARHCASYIRRISGQYERRYLLALSGYGDADMINFFDEAGNRLMPRQNREVGDQLSRVAKMVGATHIVPFSSFHRYQREDSAWANEFTTPIEAYRRGISTEYDYLGPFVEVDLPTGQVAHLDPPAVTARVLPPAHFGDDWDDHCTAEESRTITQYFKRFERLKATLGFIDVAVGGSTLRVTLDGPPSRGISFEVPRNSLVRAVNWEVFDDLLIGNFMKTTLHGLSSLYDHDVNPIIAKWGDNGRAFTDSDIRAYLDVYRRRAGGEWVRQNLIDRVASPLLGRLRRHGPLFRLGRRVYYTMR